VQNAERLRGSCQCEQPSVDAALPGGNRATEVVRRPVGMPSNVPGFIKQDAEGYTWFCTIEGSPKSAGYRPNGLPRTGAGMFRATGGPSERLIARML
jgi:hypothetical protein